MRYKIEQHATLKFDPVTLSHSATCDPFYSATSIEPKHDQKLSLLTEASAANWLYLQGDLEAWLLARMRQEARATCTYVYHPGRFPRVHNMLYAQFNWETAEQDATINIAFNGTMELLVNGEVLLKQEGTPNIQWHELKLTDLKPSNQIKVRLVSLTGPPTFCIEGAFSTDATWEASADELKWDAANCLPLVDSDVFPHAEDYLEVEQDLEVADDLYDAGCLVLARPTLKTTPGTKLQFFPGEEQDEARHATGKELEQVAPTLVANENGNCTHPLRLAFRYLRVNSESPVNDVKLLASPCPVQYRGAFACSDEKLNRIWMHAAYTLRSCMRLLVVDGLKRDRLPWVGDLYLSNLFNFHTFAESGISKRSILALLGESPSEADFNGIADYSLLWILTLKDYVLYSGDQGFLGQHVGHAREILDAFEGRFDERGLFPSKNAKWIFIDWADIQYQDYSAGLHFIYLMALKAYRDMLRFQDRDSEANTASEQVCQLEQNYQDLFWDQDSRAFAESLMSSGGRGKVSRQTNALAVLSGVANDDHKQMLLSSIFQNDNITEVGTPYMRFFEARAMAQCGSRQGMLQAVSDYWGGMLDQGASTFWEGHSPDKAPYEFYHRPFGKSLCHAWSAGPIHLLSAELFGLEATAPGWSRFTLSPASNGLAWASATIPTPQGDLRLEQEGEVLRIDILEGMTLDLGGESISGPVTLSIDQPSRISDSSAHSS